MICLVSFFFFSLFKFFFTGGNERLGRYKAFHILRQWKGGRKTYRGWEEQRKRELGEREMEKQGENDGEWEEKEGKRQRQEKGGEWRPYCSSSPPSPSPQREKTTFCQVISHHCTSFADPTLFSLKITQRKCFKFYTTCPPSPMAEHKFQYVGKLNLSAYEF